MKITINGITFRKWEVYSSNAYIRTIEDIPNNIGSSYINSEYYWISVFNPYDSDEWYFMASEKLIDLGLMFNSYNKKGLMQATNGKDAKKEADAFLMKIAKLEVFR